MTRPTSPAEDREGTQQAVVKAMQAHQDAHGRLPDHARYHCGGTCGYDIARRLAALPDSLDEARPPTAEQQERAKWRANERADRLADVVRRYGYVRWGPPDFPFPTDLAIGGVVPEPSKDEWAAALSEEP